MDEVVQIVEQEVLDQMEQGFAVLLPWERTLEEDRVIDNMLSVVRVALADVWRGEIDGL